MKLPLCPNPAPSGWPRKAGRSAGRRLRRSSSPWTARSATWSRAQERLRDTVETVWMPEGRRRRSRRRQRNRIGDFGRERGRRAPEPSRGPRGQVFVRGDAGHHLRLQPGGLRRQLPVLPDGQARLAAQPERGRDRRPGGFGLRPPQRRGGPRPREPGLHGHGRAVSELRQLHGARCGCWSRKWA